MDWKDQQQLGQNPGPPNVPPAAAPVPVPPVPAYYSNSPLQGPMVRPEQRTSNDAFLPGTNPVIEGQPPVPAMAATTPPQPPAVGMPLLAQVPVAATDDDTAVDHDDVEWVNRAKRTIASSQGDPHRQVQLMQHLRSQYLQQRFGRTVHTDET